MKTILYVFLALIGFMAVAADCGMDQFKNAAMTDNVSELKGLKAACSTNLDTLDHNGRTLLFTAVEFDAQNAVNWLLENAVSVNVQDGQKLTALHLARIPEIAQALLDAGAKPNIEDQWQRTPFHVMLELENWKLLDVLRSGGARIREQDMDWASSYYKLAVLNYLATHGTRAEIEGTGEFFRFFFFYEDAYQAVATKFLEKAASLNLAQTISSHKGLLQFYVDEYVKDSDQFRKHGFKAIEFLVKNGADVNGFSAHVGRPISHNVLIRADFDLNARLLDLFLAHGLDIELRNSSSSGKTMLMELASDITNGEYVTEMSAYLLERGANPDIQGTDGRTALHWAIRWANVPLARVLIEQTNLALQDDQGRTPLAYALERLSEVSVIDEKRALADIVKRLEAGRQ